MPSERIQLLIDVVSGNSKSTLGRLKSDLKAADGAFAKTKTAASAMGGFLKQNMALGAAAAQPIVGFGIDAAKAFTDAGVAAGLLRDQTGLTAEAASRLAEVGADIGIPVESLATSINRMNRAAASTPEAFSDIGASLQYAKDGSLDVNQTFLETIERIHEIPDAAERAEAAQEIFGRGWQQIAELIMTGADGVRDALQGVSDAQIFDDEEIAKAREMKARLEDLQDEFLKVQLGAGEFAVDFVDGLGTIGDGIAEVFQQAQRLATLQDLRNAIFGGGGGDKVGTVAKDLGLVTEKIEGMGPPAAYAAGEVEKIGIAHQRLGRDVDYAGGRLIWETDQLGDAGDAASDFEGRVQGVADEEKYLADQADLAAEAIRNLRAEVVQGLDNTFDYEKATLDLADSIREITSRTDEYNQMLADNSDDIDDNNHSADEMAAALTGVRDAQISAAEQALTTATAFAGQNGAQEGSRQHTQRLKEELQRLADANPAIRGEIQKYIDKLDAIKPVKPTKAEFNKAEAEQAALDYRNRLEEIKTEVRTTAHLQTGDAMSAANAFEARLNSIQDEVVNVITNYVDNRPSGGGLGVGAGAAPFTANGEGFSTTAGAAAGGGGGGGGGIRPNSRVRGILNRAAEASEAANALEPQIKALGELAAATEDADEKEKLLDKRTDLLKQRQNLLEKATRLADSAAERHAKSIGREENELRREVETLRKHAEKLREQADAAREAGAARSEALGEQATSLREAFDAERSLADAREQAARAQDGVADADERLAEARKQSAEANRKQTINGVTTYVHGAEERRAAEEELADAQQARSDANREALRAEEDAAIAIADAEVQLARERAEAQGKAFTTLQEIAARRASLQRQGRTDLIAELGLDKAAALEKQRLAALAQAEKSADKLERAAAKDEANANTNEKAANKLEKFADKLPDAIAKAFAIANRQNLTERELERLIRKILASA